MKFRKVICVVMLLCSVLLFGCDNSEEIDGGNTTIEDDVPKTIESKDITGFYASFYIYDRSFGNDEHDFEFEIKKNKDGELYAYENNSKSSYQADEELLKQLQQVIDDNNLVQYNGLYDVTQGLPSEYSARSFKAEYASGEELYFTMDNDPSAKYAIDIYDVFVKWFSSHGIDSLYPREETTTISKLYLVYEHDDVCVIYDNFEEGGKEYIYRYVENNNEYSQMKDDRKVTMPDDYYDVITKIVEESKLNELYLSDSFTKGIDKEAKTCIDLNIEYGTSKSIIIETSDEDEMKLLMPAVNNLMNYLDSWFME